MSMLDRRCSVLVALLGLFMLAGCSQDTPTSVISLSEPECRYTITPTKEFFS